MKIGILSHAFPPHTVGGLTEHNEKTARALAATGHEVHVITNQAWHGATAPWLTARYWREGGLHIHRLPLFDEQERVPSYLRFFDVDPGRYGGDSPPWAFDPFHLAAQQMAEFVAILQAEVGLEVVESPERYGAAYYLVRRRRAGLGHLYPPVTVNALGNTRQALQAEGKRTLLGSPPLRRLMAQEAECLHQADGLIAPPERLAGLEEQHPQPFPPCRVGLAADGEMGVRIAHLEELVAREEKARAGGPGAFALPDRLLPGRPPRPLPGAGLVLVDAIDAAPAEVAATCASLEAALPGSETWTVALLGGEKGDAPPGWSRHGADSPAPWRERAEGDLLVYLRAGTTLDSQALLHLVTLAGATDPPGGAFLWVRPADIRVFPYRPDLALPDIMLGAGILPPAFAAPCGPLRALTDLGGLEDPVDRIAALMAVAASGNIRFRHTAQVQGDYYGDLPLLGPSAQARVTGILDTLGLLPAEITSFGNLEYPAPPREEGDESPPPPGDVPIEELERVYREHQRLKRMAPVRWLRGLGILAAARRLCPGVKKAIGPG